MVESEINLIELLPQAYRKALRKTILKEKFHLETDGTVHRPELAGYVDGFNSHYAKGIIQAYQVKRNSLLDNRLLAAQLAVRMGELMELDLHMLYQNIQEAEAFEVMANLEQEAVQPSKEASTYEMQ